MCFAFAFPPMRVLVIHGFGKWNYTESKHLKNGSDFVIVMKVNY